MELHSPYWLLGRCIGSKLNVGCRGDALVVLGNSCDGVAVAHPHLRVLYKSLEQRVLCVEVLQIGTSVLTGVGSLNLSAIGVADELCAIADAEHRNASHKLAQVHLEGLLVVYRVGASAEDNANHGWVVLRELVVGHNLAEGVELAYTTAYKLCGLRTEIKNYNLLLHLLICYLIISLSSIIFLPLMQETLPLVLTCQVFQCP